MSHMRLQALPGRSLCSLSQPVLRKRGLAEFRPRWLQAHQRAAASMAPRKDSIPHEMRTAAEPRQNKLHAVRLAHIEQINPSVRLLRLSLAAGEDADVRSSSRLGAADCS